MRDLERVTALLFDLGGVLIEADFDRAIQAWSASAGVEAETIGARFVHQECDEMHERGEVNFGEYCDFLRRSLGVELTDAEFEAGWISIYVGEMPNVRGIIERLRSSYSLFAFTNTNATHQAVWSTRFEDLLKPFSGIFVSCEMGLRKPEHAAFEDVIRRIGVPRGEVLFLDDLQENVAAAVNIGLQSVLVRGISDIERVATALGV